MVEGLKPGARLRSAVDEVEVVVLKTTVDEADLRCGGVEMVPVGGSATEQRGAAPASAEEGTLLGKRYVDEAETLEVLCVKAGPSALSLGDELLHLREAKPLPASD